MIDVNYFIQSVLDQANKDGAGFQPNAAEKNRFMQNALREVYDYLFGLMSSYRPNDATPPVSMEATRAVSEAERYLHENRVIAVNNGEVLIPDGDSVLDMNGDVCPEFRHLKRIQVRYIVPGTNEIKLYNCRVLEGDDAEFNLNSPINQAHFRQPIAELSKDRYKIHVGDSSVAFVNFIYQRKYILPVWGFTTDTSLPDNEQREIYDPDTSTDIDLPDTMFTLLKERCLEMMGIRERDEAIVSSAARRNSYQ